MLVLTRKEGEVIVVPVIGMRIVLLSSRSGKARIGIEADPHIDVVREEILEERGPDHDPEIVSESVAVLAHR